MASIEIPRAAPISEYAIIVNPNDNVAVVKKATTQGLGIMLPAGAFVEVRSAVPPGHRFATRDIPAGEFVLQFGQPIGTSLGIKSGEQITHANMSNDVPIVRDLPEDLHTPAPNYIPEAERAGGIEAKAEQHKHREFQFWAEQTVSL
jgi:altronate hydrolase